MREFVIAQGLRRWLYSHLRSLDLPRELHRRYWGIHRFSVLVMGQNPERSGTVHVLAGSRSFRRSSHFNSYGQYMATWYLDMVVTDCREWSTSWAGAVLT